MNNEQGASGGLPQAVIEAISRKRTIEAIKLLRKERNIDLKEAKEAVDRFIGENPALYGATAVPKEEGTLGRFLLIIILILLAVAGYYLFA